MANISCVPFHFETRFTDSGSSYLMNIWFSLAICRLVKHRMIEWYKLIIHDRIKTTDKNNTLLIIQLSDLIGCKQFPS